MTRPDACDPSASNDYPRFAESLLESAEGAFIDVSPHGGTKSGNTPQHSASVLTPNTLKRQYASSQKSTGLCYFNPTADPPVEIVYYEGLLSEGDLAVWIGREKHRKSTLLLQLAICAAIGRKFLCFRSVRGKPITVVYFDYESKTRSLKTRYEAMCNAMSLSDAERELLTSNLTIVEVRQTQRNGGKIPRFPLKDTDKEADTFWTRFADEHKAALYIFDPMRCVHGAQENDSEIEQLLTRFRERFHGGTVIIAHHMRKQSGGKDNAVKLKDNMREWSDGGRGSVAIKAHSDVIICQERDDAGGTEMIYFGAFMRDGADITPLSLAETGPESFFFEVVPTVPDTYRSSYEVLKRKGRTFANRADAARVIEQELKLSRAATFRHVDILVKCGVLTEKDGGSLVLTATGDPVEHRALQGAGPVPGKGK